MNRAEAVEKLREEEDERRKSATPCPYCKGEGVTYRYGKEFRDGHGTCALCQGLGIKDGWNNPIKPRAYFKQHEIDALCNPAPVEQAATQTAVRVCSTRDIECGSNPAAWCSACPKRASQAAPVTVPEHRPHLEAIANALREKAAQEQPAKIPQLRGVSRDMESPGQKSVLLAFDRALTDDELRALHQMLAAAPAAPSADAQDAKRYRYLRDCGDVLLLGRAIPQHRPEIFDAAIDAALSAQKEGE